MNRDAEWRQCRHIDTAGRFAVRVQHAGPGVEQRADEVLRGQSDQRIERKRDPATIALNMSRAIGPLDTLSHTGYEQIVETLGEPFTSRIVAAEYT